MKTIFQQWVEVEEARIDIATMQEGARTPNFEEYLNAAQREATRQAKVLMNQFRKGSRARVIYR